MIRVRCPSCGKMLSVGEERAGQSLPCRYCGELVAVEIHEDFAAFAAPTPRYDPRSAVRDLEKQMAEENRTWVFLWLAGAGSVVASGVAVSLQPGVGDYLPGFLGALGGALVGGAALPTLTSFLVAGGGQLRKGFLAALPKVRDPAVLMRVVTWLAAMGFFCGSAAGAYLGARYGNPLADRTMTAALAYLGSFVGVLPALVRRWREGKAGGVGEVGSRDRP